MTMLDARGTVDDTPPLFTIAEPRLFASRRHLVPERNRDWLESAAAQVRLAGRGGAAFPVAAKLAAVRRGARIVANGPRTLAISTESINSSVRASRLGCGTGLVKPAELTRTSQRP